MRILNNGQLLKTKIVATVGKERSGPQAGKKDEIFRPDGNPVTGVLKHSELLQWLINSGADVIRLNMSFASDQRPYGAVERKILKWIAAKKNGLARHIAVLGDLPGPKIRLKVVRSYNLKTGNTFSLNFVSKRLFPKGKNGATVLVNDQPFSNVARVNGFPTIDDYVAASNAEKQDAIFFIGDGKVILKALSSSNGIVKCLVMKGGAVENRQGVTIKRADIHVPPFLDQDKKALEFLLEHGSDVVTYIGVSFVNSAEDILIVKREVEKKLARYGRKARRYAPAIIAKFETRRACEPANLNKILDVSDCVMVARGDLGLQLDPEKVPAIQKEIIRQCNLRGKPVITATQMLDSMETNTEPTRAEANDVFNAIQDGTDAVMLSGETSKGKYPSQAVEMMVQIAEQAEAYYAKRYSGRAYKGHLQDVLKESEELSQETTARLEDSYAVWKRHAETADENLLLEASEEYWWKANLFAEKIERSQKQTTTDCISESACLLSEGKDYKDEDFKAIIAPTTSGRTARMISRFRPNVPIIGAAHDEANARKLIISFGVYPLCIGEFRRNAGVERVFDAARDEAIKKGYIWNSNFNLLTKGDMVISTSGTPLLKIGTTNLIQIRTV